MAAVTLVGLVGILAPACSSSSGDSAATCGGKTGEKQEKATYGEGTPPDGSGKNIGMVFDVGGRGDKGFNDSAYNGLTAAAKAMKVDASASVTLTENLGNDCITALQARLD